MTKNAKEVGLAKARLIKFGSKTCGACIAMDRAKTLEKFQERYPEVTILKLDISDEEGESPAPRGLGDINYKANYALSDEYEVTALPTLILELAGCGEVMRLEGAANLKQLDEMYTSTFEYAGRANRIPWEGDK